MDTRVSDPNHGRENRSYLSPLLWSSDPRAPKGERGAGIGGPGRDSIGATGEPLPRPSAAPGRRPLLLRITHRPRAQPGMEQEGASSIAEPHPARQAEADPPRTPPGSVTGLWAHRWDSELGSQPPENTAPVLLPLASQFRRREISPIHRLNKISITAAPSGRRSPEQALN